MLVFCSGRGLASRCRDCDHAVSHVPENVHFDGSHTCDGGQICHAPRLILGKVVFNDALVIGTKIVGEVRCVPIEASDRDLLVQAASAFTEVLNTNKYKGFEKKTVWDYGRKVLGDIVERLKQP